jgi:hypothetical protein
MYTNTLAVCTISNAIGGGTNTVANGSDPRSVTLGTPNKIVIDAAGNIYFTENARHRVWKLDAASGVILLVAGTGTCGSTGKS